MFSDNRSPSRLKTSARSSYFPALSAFHRKSSSFTEESSAMFTHLAACRRSPARVNNLPFDPRAVDRVPVIIYYPQTATKIFYDPPNVSVVFETREHHLKAALHGEVGFRGLAKI